MSGRRVEIRRTPDGGHEMVEHRPRQVHRVTFSRPSTADRDTAAGLHVNARVAYVGGRRVGILYGVDPAPGNPHRPTAFEFAPDQVERARLRFTRIEEARSHLGYQYPEET